jgi:hypothetical protein
LLGVADHLVPVGAANVMVSVPPVSPPAALVVKLVVY